VTSKVRQARRGYSRIALGSGLISCGVLSGCGAAEPRAGSPSASAESSAEVTGEPTGVASLRAGIECVPPSEELHEDWVPMPLALADVGSWLKVHALVAGSAESAAQGESIIVSAANTENGELADHAVQLWAGAVDMLADAFATPGVEVYLGVGSSSGQLPDDLVWVPLALDSTGFTVIGQCDAIRSNEELETAFGTDAVSTVRSALWLSGDELVAALGLEGEPPPSTVAVQIVPGMTHDESALDTFDTHAVSVLWPSDARSDSFTFCVRAQDVWGGCVLLGALAPDAGAYSLPFAVPAGSDPAAEVWLLDASANSNGPKVLVAEIDGESFLAGHEPLVAVEQVSIPAGAVTPQDVEVGDVEISQVEVAVDDEQQLHP
jgi:hypothetical protein